MDFRNQLIGLTHGNDPEQAKTMAALLKERLSDCTALSRRTGSVLGSHPGIGVVGVFCPDQRPEEYSFLAPVYTT